MENAEAGSRARALGMEWSSYLEWNWKAGVAIIWSKLLCLCESVVSTSIQRLCWTWGSGCLSSSCNLSGPVAYICSSQPRRPLSVSNLVLISSGRLIIITPCSLYVWFHVSVSFQPFTPVCALLAVVSFEAGLVSACWSHTLCRMARGSHLYVICRNVCDRAIIGHSLLRLLITWFPRVKGQIAAACSWLLAFSSLEALDQSPK